MNVALKRECSPFEGAPAWFPWWRGETVVLVASGPSAKDVPLDLAKGSARFIAINNSWQLAPWADVLYACDGAWWKNANGCPEFGGLKLTIDRRTTQEHDWGVRRVECSKGSDMLELRKINTIGWGGNSGFGALNLAIQFGASKIILVGYDMTVSYGAHWHGEHPSHMNNPRPGNVERWRRAIDNAAKQIEPLGIKVINCSPISKLQNYPRMTFQEALEE
ncbi:hypothetical protein [Aminobacter sp. SR38]|jgi:hypothetical protein|uniref:hypothetical protein n=1 Tax=Aminobacter sp. SR38 TaxID=2774562 RepID=UPI001FEF63B0|nr:hypothetical protein [Aminobacter sp. SR38]